MFLYLYFFGETESATELGAYRRFLIFLEDRTEARVSDPHGELCS